MGNHRKVNLVFAVFVAILGATAVISAYLARNRPPILETAPAGNQEMNLPEGHPPLDTSDRLARLEQLSRANPDNPEYRVQLGNAYYDMAQYQSAIGAYEESLRLRPQDPGVETDLATCYHYIGQSEKALQRLDHVLQYAPGFPQALFNKGVVLIDGIKDSRAGIAVWEELLGRHPDFPQRAEIERRIRQIQPKALP